jgi:hypothetical protein
MDITQVLYTQRCATAALRAFFRFTFGRRAHVMCVSIQNVRTCCEFYWVRDCGWLARWCFH